MKPVSGIGNNGNPIRSLADVVAATPAAGTKSTSSVETNRTGVALQDKLDLSDSGQLLSRFQQLQSQDPERFKQAVGSVVDLLQKTSQELGDTREGRLVADVAASFQQLSEGGEISPLAPRPEAGSSIANQRYRQAQEIGERGSFGYLAARLGDDASASGQGVVSQVLSRVVDAVVESTAPTGS